MPIRFAFLITFIFCSSSQCYAQTSLVEGLIVYKVTINAPNDAKHVSYKGTYTITLKGRHIRKELRLNNGYEDILILDYVKNTVYSLKDVSGKRYGIQLEISDFTKRQEEYRIKNVKDNGNSQEMAGFTTKNGTVTYFNKGAVNIIYTKNIYASEENTFDRFPGIKVLPASFTYDTEQGGTMRFTLDKVQTTNVENSTFIVPDDYTIITHNEYEEMTK